MLVTHPACQAQASLHLRHCRSRCATHARFHSPTRLSRRALVCTSATGSSNPRTQRLRDLLKRDEILKGPCCHDALSARLIEQAGFPYAFMSGFCTSAARLGAPDTGLISYYEMMDQGRYVNEATKAIPIIGDGDTGYGNALNVKRTVRGYASAGFAGILIEDQFAPKSCGHVRGKKVVSREDALARIRAAVDAREEGNDILILARTDARQAESLEEALWRAAAFADAGADILFIDALESKEEMLAFTRLGGAAQDLPKMANMLEGGGKTPILPPEELQHIGFKLVAYPLSLLGVSIRAMELALERLQEGQLPSATAMGSFMDIQRAVGFPEYYSEEARYAVSSPFTSSPPSSDATPEIPEVSPQIEEPQHEGRGTPEPPREAPPSPSSSSSAPEVEPDSIILVPATDRGRDSRQDSNFRRDRVLRVKISDRRTGMVKLETRIPAGFMQGLGAVVPQTAGMNLEALMQQVLGEKQDLSKPILNFSSAIDDIEIYLE